MKNKFIFIILLLTPFASNAGSAELSIIRDTGATAFQVVSEPADLKEYRDQVLNNRFSNLVAIGLSALENCEHQALAQKISDKIQKKNPVAVLSAFQYLHYLDKMGVCSGKIGQAIRNFDLSERRLFTFVKSELIKSSWLLAGKVGADVTRKMWSDLDPSCSSNNIPAYQGSTDTNPCFAGDQALLSIVEPRQNYQKQNLLAEVIVLVDKMRKTIDSGNLSKGQTLDLWKLYNTELKPHQLKSPMTKLFFLGLITYTQSTSSSKKGYVDHFHERFLRANLENNLNPKLVYQAYESIKRIRDLAFILLSELQQKGISLSIKGKDVSSWNRHNFMSAYLTCFYKTSGHGADSNLIPKLLGIAYETKDFASHLSEGWKLKQAKENFKNDTARYKQAADWAMEFCSAE